MPRAVRFLHSLADFERLRIVRYTEETFDLGRMRTLLKKLGNPQDKIKTIHVAGTKGKGSTCAMIAAMLRANGYRVGVYSSPHLLDIRERITVDGEMIGQTDFIRLVREIEPHVTKAKNTPTFFDSLTAVAFCYFAAKDVDFAVIETGLGGRLDSTNVIKPEVAAIAPISMDHTAQLGNTLAKIAREKAGIFKAGIPAVTVAQDPAALAQIKQIAADVGCPLEVLGETMEFSYRFEASRSQGRHNRVCLTTRRTKIEHLAVPLLGEHQAVNLGLALAVLDQLKLAGHAIDDAKATTGLTGLTMPGRMETLAYNPRVLVDCAHNAASIDAMLRAIGQHVPYDSMLVIFGCCADKDVSGMLERVTTGADKVIFTRVPSVRSADPHDLAKQYGDRFGKMSQVAESLDGALEIARRACTRDDLICITGSVYLVAQAKQVFAGRRKTA